MQLVLPKGKVEATLLLSFRPVCGYPCSFSNFLNMEITINQQQHQLQEACSVEQMLAIVLANVPKGIAVAVNQNIISKSQWPDHVLKAGDQVILIKATQGG
jgi:sulfur carrier protein